MSIDAIEPIRIVATPKIERLERDRERPREEPSRQPQDEREQQDEQPEDDGLPHIDVRA